MTKICLFAGTTEGRRLTEFLSKQDTNLTVCVATDYGESLLQEGERISVSHKRLSAEEILRMLTDEHFDLVIDATHPYAVTVTENILEGCRRTGTEYVRLVREASGLPMDAVIVPDISTAIDFLNNTAGNILLTTGSKELQKFTGITDFSERVYARVLPMQSSLEACSAAGLKPSHIIAIQGPFSEEMNLSTLRAVRAQWLVTKDSGEPGGFEAKVIAAQQANAGLIVIGRPAQQKGLTEAETISLLTKRFGFIRKAQVKIIGIGPGNQKMMTTAAQQAISEADCLIGAKRMLEAVSSRNQICFEAVAAESVAAYIRSHPEYRSFAVLMSGDSGFFSGTRRLLPLLDVCDVEVIPGISSLSYLCAKIHVSSEEIHPVSLHGRNLDIVREVREHLRVFVLTGGKNNVKTICQKLCDAEFHDIRITVGERLSYPDEKITKGCPRELSGRDFDPLSVILIENDSSKKLVTHGLPDNYFIRDNGEKGPVPMTKSEIRSICLSKLALTEDAICWDIGSGTGSISIEMALCAKKGMVYAIERDPDALALSKMNAQRLFASNITFVEGSAPEVLKDLPIPTHVFIGGASGKIKEIFQLLFDKGAPVRIVITAVTLDTIAELTEIVNLFSFIDTEVVMVQTSRSKQAGAHLLMQGGNPVTVFTLQI